MKRTGALLLLSLLGFIPPSLPQAAQPGEIHVWLTTNDRSALLAPQPAALQFNPTTPADRVIDVNSMEQYQSMQGFGLALTGGSAQLLQQMSPAKRADLLQELFAPAGNSIHVTYLRVSIGSSDMNDHAYTYDDLPPDRPIHNWRSSVSTRTVPMSFPC